MMNAPAEMLDQIRKTDKMLTTRFQSRLEVNPDLARKLVSFQANKSEIGNRWFKYKEGFSASLIRYIFERVGLQRGHLLDPFAGSGTALFEASTAGIESTGIELLPSSAEGIEVRHLLRQADPARMAALLRDFRLRRVWEADGPTRSFAHIAITRGAFSQETESQLGRYLYEAQTLADSDAGRVLRFAAMCILESISYTRKDGQYLRWDYRSGRKQGAKPFDKGKIFGFSEAITAKIREIEEDLCAATVPRHLFDEERCPAGAIHLRTGSCLDILPTLETAGFDSIVTSPPYANRYDYTRTYALELAMMGVGETGIRALRQAMLTCTVENKAKDYLADQYPAERYCAAMQAFERQEILQQILAYLEACKADGSINNTGIPRMVRNYFAEMALMIFEAARVLRPGAPFVMVNDNVRYMGAHIPVDLILSDFAERAGFVVEKIWVLPRGKGNSSQQMGTHGREEVRKCVYVWRH